jgi:DNA replication and repair protein RecF
MHLKKLSVFNFKNYDEAELVFSPGVNAFTGDNGAGKTNLLDAIHYLSLCKSYFNPADVQQIKPGREFFMVQGIFDRENREEIVSVSLKRNQKKQVKRNKKEYPRLAGHIGLFPLVMISPYDTNLITEGSEERRRFIDTVLSQTDNRYLDELIRYNKVLQNRNSLLKQIAETGRYDPSLLEILDEQLSVSGKIVYEKRSSFMTSFEPLFIKHYRYLAADAEETTMSYESDLSSDTLPALLEKWREKDRTLQRTTAGIHKDDLVFTIHGLPLKKFASQGQLKSFLIALKLAQYSYLLQQKGFRPLLLLDDIFDKLDEKRTRKLMQMVSEDDFGQIFITDTSRDRVEGIFRDIGTELRLFGVKNGTLVSYEPHE